MNMSLLLAKDLTYLCSRGELVCKFLFYQLSNYIKLKYIYTFEI